MEDEKLQRLRRAMNKTGEALKKRKPLTDTKREFDEAFADFFGLEQSTNGK